MDKSEVFDVADTLYSFLPLCYCLQVCWVLSSLLSFPCFWCTVLLLLQSPLLWIFITALSPLKESRFSPRYALYHCIRNYILHTKSHLCCVQCYWSVHNAKACGLHWLHGWQRNPGWNRWLKPAPAGRTQKRCLKDCLMDCCKVTVKPLLKPRAITFPECHCF